MPILYKYIKVNAGFIRQLYFITCLQARLFNLNDFDTRSMKRF